MSDELKIDHEYTHEIVCPHCGYEFSDSWEVRADSEDMGELECHGCSQPFYANRNVEVTYVTSIITAEDRERERLLKERDDLLREKWRVERAQWRFRRKAWRQLQEEKS